MLLAILSSLAAEAPADGSCASTYRLRLALVRHGESMNNVHEDTSWNDYTTKRSPDPELSPRGFEQAKLLGAYLRDEVASASLGIHPISEIWVSPHKRTLQTVAPTAQMLQMAPKVHTRCFEAGGVYTNNEAYTEFVAQGGLSRKQMQEGFPTYELPDTVTEDGWYVDEGGKGREGTALCRARAKGVAAELIALAASLAADKQILLVAHYDFICALLDALVLKAGAPSGDDFDNWKHFNTGTTVLDIDASTGAVSVLMQNAIGHIITNRRTELVSGFPL